MVVQHTAGERACCWLPLSWTPAVATTPQPDQGRSYMRAFPTLIWAHQHVTTCSRPLPRQWRSSAPSDAPPERRGGIAAPMVLQVYEHEERHVAWPYHHFTSRRQGLSITTEHHEKLNVDKRRSFPPGILGDTHATATTKQGHLVTIAKRCLRPQIGSGGLKHRPIACLVLLR